MRFQLQNRFKLILRKWCKQRRRSWQHLDWHDEIVPADCYCVMYCVLRWFSQFTTSARYEKVVVYSIRCAVASLFVRCVMQCWNLYSAVGHLNSGGDVFTWMDKRQPCLISRFNCWKLNVLGSIRKHQMT